MSQCLYQGIVLKFWRYYSPPIRVRGTPLWPLLTSSLLQARRILQRVTWNMSVIISNGFYSFTLNILTVVPDALMFIWRNNSNDILQYICLYVCIIFLDICMYTCVRMRICGLCIWSIDDCHYITVIFVSFSIRLSPTEQQPLIMNECQKWIIQ